MSSYIGFAGVDGRLSLVAIVTGEKEGAVEGTVVNGAWSGVFTDESVYVVTTQQTYPGHIVWRGDLTSKEIGDDYGFTFVEAKIAEVKK